MRIQLPAISYLRAVRSLDTIASQAISAKSRFATHKAAYDAKFHTDGVHIEQLSTGRSRNADVLAIDLNCAENGLYDADCLDIITETRVCRCYCEKS